MDISGDTNSRLKKIERELFCWKIGGMSALLLLVAGMMLGARGKDFSDELKVHTLIIVDEKGSPRGTIVGSEDGAILALGGGSAIGTVMLAAVKEGAGLAVLGDKKSKLMVPA